MRHLLGMQQRKSYKKRFIAIKYGTSWSSHRSEKDGSHYDRFRGRVMFPIYTLQGKVIAFSGRALGDDTPKYLNSPETPIFHKSKLLYNFHQARPFIRKRGQVVLLKGMLTY